MSSKGKGKPRTLVAPGCLHMPPAGRVKWQDRMTAVPTGTELGDWRNASKRVRGL